MPRVRSVIEFGTSKIVCMIDSENIRGIDVPSSSCVRYEGIVDGAWADFGGLSAAVREAIELAEGRIKKQIRNVEIGVPAAFEKVVAVNTRRTIQGNRVSIDDINMLIQAGMPRSSKEWELIDARPGYFIDDMGELYIDPPVNMRSKYIEGCICYMYAKSSFVNEMVELFDSLHIEVDNFLFENLSQALRYIPQDARDKCCILLDVGYENTAVSVVFGDAVLSYDVIYYGSAKIVRDLQNNLGIDAVLAENLKRGYSFGLNIDKEGRTYGKNAAGKMICFDHRAVKMSIEKSTSFLVNEVRYVLEDFKKYITPRTPIYLIGAGLQMRSIESFLVNRFNRKVNVQTNDDTYSLPSVYNTALALLDNRADTVYHLEDDGTDVGGVGAKASRLLEIFKR